MAQAGKNAKALIRLNGLFSFTPNVNRRTRGGKKKMQRVWYQQDKQAVVKALQSGERPDLATTKGGGPLDELVALHQELRIFEAVNQVEMSRQRAGLPDELLLRTLATLP